MLNYIPNVRTTRRIEGTHSHCCVMTPTGLPTFPTNTHCVITPIGLATNPPSPPPQNKHTKTHTHTHTHLKQFGPIVATLLPLPLVLFSPDLSTPAQVLALVLPSLGHFFVGYYLVRRFLLVSFVSFCGGGGGVGGGRAGPFSPFQQDFVFLRRWAAPFSYQTRGGRRSLSCAHHSLGTCVLSILPFSCCKQEPRLFGEHLEVHPIIIILSLGSYATCCKRDQHPTHNHSHTHHLFFFLRIGPHPTHNHPHPLYDMGVD